MAEIDQKAQAMASGFQVIMDLSTVFIGEVLNSLDFNDYFAKTDKIRLVCLIQTLTFILQCEFCLGDKRNA